MSTHPDDLWSPRDEVDDLESRGAFDDVIDPPDPDRDTRMGSDAARALERLRGTAEQERHQFSHSFAQRITGDADLALHRALGELETFRELWQEAIDIQAEADRRGF